MAHSLIGIFWFVFTVVWIVLSLKAKKSRGGSGQRQNPWIRLVVTVAAVIFIFNLGVFNNFLAYELFPSSFLSQSLGVIICAVGIAFAIWARVHLGRNWGMPMSVKEIPELVTTGPYHFVRHPIYTGMAVALLGSWVTAGTIWLVWFVLFSWYFVYSAHKEEKLMLKQFPDEYPGYMKRTKRLIPFVY